MKHPRPGFVRTPTPLAAALIALSVLPLPAGSRDRWSDECRAELVDVRRTRQIAAAAGCLAGSFALRSALRADPDDPEAVSAPKPLRCRVGRHLHQIVADANPENRGYKYLVCVLCGKIKEGKGDDFLRVGRPITIGLG